jgi:hypothetical protein
MLTAAALNVNYNASVLFRIVARPVRPTRRMVGGPLFRSVKRLAVCPHCMVGGPLFRSVTLAAGLALSVVGA